VASEAPQPLSHTPEKKRFVHPRRKGRGAPTPTMGSSCDVSVHAFSSDHDWSSKSSTADQPRAGTRHRAEVVERRVAGNVQGAVSSPGRGFEIGRGDRRLERPARSGWESRNSIWRRLPDREATISNAPGMSGSGPSGIRTLVRRIKMRCSCAPAASHGVSCQKSVVDRQTRYQQVSSKRCHRASRRVDTWIQKPAGAPPRCP
jgi:hypothetical protein